MRKDRRNSFMTAGNRTLAAAVSAMLLLSACETTGNWLKGRKTHDAPDVEMTGEQADPYVAEMYALVSGDPATQAEIYADAKAAAELTPDPQTKLRYALVLATPGHSATNELEAQKQFRDLLARTELLTHTEISLANIHLRDVETRLMLGGENQRLQSANTRAATTEDAAVARRMAAIEDEKSPFAPVACRSRGKTRGDHVNRAGDSRVTRYGITAEESKLGSDPNLLSSAVTSLSATHRRFSSTPYPAANHGTMRDMANANSESRGKILLVDDDPGLLRLLSIRLRAEQYEVEAVESAEKALSVLHRFRPDLVVTDLRMDKMDGIGLLKELQTRSPGLRVLIMTAHGTIPDAVVATQSGAFGFLTKPIDKDELMATVDRAMKVSGSADVDEDWSKEIITRNQKVKEILAQAKMVAATDARVFDQR